MIDGKPPVISIAQLIGDARRGVTDLLHAEIGVFGAEMRTKLSSSRAFCCARRRSIAAIWVSMLVACLASEVV